MSHETEIIATEDDQTRRDEVNSVCPAGPMWLVPAITFGVRAAALAGLVLAGGLAVAGLGDALNVGMEGTTCCPPV